MILTMNIDDFNENNVIINEKIKNKVLNNSDFYRIIYSDEFSSTSGIFIIFNLKDIILEKYFNKIKCLISDKEENHQIIKSMQEIEKTIMDKYVNETNKKPVYRISEQLDNKFIKLYGNDKITFKNYDNLNFLVKISGIWDSDETKDFGLTFRFFIFNNLF